VAPAARAPAGEDLTTDLDGARQAPGPSSAARLKEDTARQSEPALDSSARPPAMEPVAQRSPGPVIRTFESELGPFRFDRLDSGHFVLYRWAWRDGARYVQGALIERDPFLAALIRTPFDASALGRSARLRVDWANGGGDAAAEPLATFAAPAAGDYEISGTGRLPAGTVVYRGRLGEPFGALWLRFEVAHLPTPPGASVILWLGAVLALVLLAGSLGLYRLGLRQLALLRQQRDFVSAVSHELKTPLTAIRMYSEMLREGWAADEKRPGYYRYIHDEAERLSRLVTNVLQLARMSRDELRVEVRPVGLAEALAQARPTLASLAEQAGFTLAVDCETGARVRADPDALTQVLINLVDNSIKFAGGDLPDQARRIEIRCLPAERGWAILSVRDQGPGIPRHQRRRALALFQRLEREATRETKGTGIGLALVDRLMRAMGGRLELHDALPGLEVRLRLAVAD
jgi:signal transduction histidine kinase